MTNFDYEKDSFFACDLKRQSNRNTFYEYDVIYPWTNEDLREFFHDFKLENKKILTVTSSGDHFLNMVLNGATDITCFDINKLTKYYQELKIAYIKMNDFNSFKKGLTKKLTYYELITYFKNNKEKFKPFLRMQVLNFWNLVLSKCEPMELVSFDVTYHLYQKNEYFDEEKYDFLRNRLESVEPIYVDCDIKDLSHILRNNKYDYIFTSNIFYYYIKTGTYLNIINSLNDILNEKGKIIQYSFRPHHENDLYFDRKVNYDKKIVYRFEDKDEDYYESVISYKKKTKGD